MSEFLNVAHRASNGRVVAATTASGHIALVPERPSYLLMSRVTFKKMMIEDGGARYINIAHSRDQRIEVFGVGIIFDEHQPEGVVQSVYGATSHE